MDARDAGSTSAATQDANRALTYAEIDEAKRLAGGLLEGSRSCLSPSKQTPSQGLPESSAAGDGLPPLQLGPARTEAADGSAAEGLLTPKSVWPEPPEVAVSLSDLARGPGAAAEEGPLEVAGRLAGTPTESRVHAETAEPAADQPAAKPKQPFKFLRRKDPAPGVTNVQSKAPVGLLPFLRGTGTDYYGRRLNEVLEWDFDRMEKVHNYIQWLFPTDEPSRHNHAAPQFTPDLQARVREDVVLQSALLKATQRFCAFLGLELVRAEGDGQGAGVVVRKAPHYAERIPTCWDTRFGGNHNWLRISRVLHCLRLAGMDAEAAALLQCLEELHAEGVPCGAAMPHWRKRAAALGRPRRNPPKPRAGPEAKSSAGCQDQLCSSPDAKPIPLAESKPGQSLEVEPRISVEDQVL